MNGMYDLISSFLMALGVIIYHSTAMDKENSAKYLAFPVIMAIFGLCLLMFVIALE